MTDQTSDASVLDSIDPVLKVVTAEIEISAPTEAVFELIADPQRQPEWDGNDNLGSAVEGQRVRGTGGSFITTLTKGVDRENHIVDFAEGRLIAWKPSEVGESRSGRNGFGSSRRPGTTRSWSDTLTTGPSCAIRSVCRGRSRRRRRICSRHSSDSNSSPRPENPTRPSAFPAGTTIQFKLADADGHFGQASAKRVSSDASCARSSSVKVLNA